MKSQSYPIHNTTTLLPDLALVEAPPVEISPLPTLDAPLLPPASASSLTIYPHTAEHLRMVQSLARMRGCEVWGLPPSFHASTLAAIEHLSSKAYDGSSHPVGWELLRVMDPQLHEELAAYEACAALQRMEGVLSEGDQAVPWSRARCHEALRALRALVAHQQKVSATSYTSHRMDYAPPLSATPLMTGIGTSLSMGH